ncbi:thiamine pyrophosphokinase Thi80 [Schizopora paradoxa]|uniref:Thiamine pyrophosphokinase n=1 Tax=Schizopora paradoxa TaxID=27342 RepID=A0A0H2RNN8_9AGAM|nr:thiamine pyrophosphokinase Thi80 [Schizopora paradoxa]
MLNRRKWSFDFLQVDKTPSKRRSLIILNQPFTLELFLRLWDATDWRCCADGGANRLFDLLQQTAKAHASSERVIDGPCDFLPDLIKGDLDSIRPDVRDFYASKGVPVVHDHDQNSTDLMKCVVEVQTREAQQSEQNIIIILGGLSGRLDQTIHTLQLLHKLRKERSDVYAVTDDNIGWVLDEGSHIIEIDHSIVGKTCGLLPVGIESTMLTTEGLQWNLTNTESSFNGMVSTSNAVVASEVLVSTTKPIFWCIVLAPRQG